MIETGWIRENPVACGLAIVSSEVEARLKYMTDQVTIYSMMRTYHSPPETRGPLREELTREFSFPRGFTKDPE